METVEILAKVLAELIRRLREHRLLTDADVLALTAILKKMEAMHLSPLIQGKSIPLAEATK
jgi:hypothetical protein